MSHEPWYENQNGTVDKETLSRLLDKVDINSQSELYWPALLAYSYWGMTDCVTLLLDHGAKVNNLTTNGRSALFLAVWNEKYRTARVLLNRGADPDIIDDRGHTALEMAVAISNTDMVKLLLQHGADATINKRLFMAKTNHHLHMTEIREILMGHEEMVWTEFLAKMKFHL